MYQAEETNEQPTWALIPMEDGALIAHRATQTWKADAEVACLPGVRVAFARLVWDAAGLAGLSFAEPKRVVECACCHAAAENKSA